MLARIMGDVQLGVLQQELVQLVLHGKDASYHNGTLRINTHIALEHLRKPFVHACSNLLVLFGT